MNLATPSLSEGDYHQSARFWGSWAPGKKSASDDGNWIPVWTKVWTQQHYKHCLPSTAEAHIFVFSTDKSNRNNFSFGSDWWKIKKKSLEVKTFYLYLVCPDNFCNLLLTEILSYFSIYINWQAQSAFTYAANISRGKTGKEQRDEHLLLHLLQITVKNQREFVYDSKCQFGIKLHHANPS